MRLLLDANLSPKRVGGPLEGRGHDVLSLASDAALGALADPEVLALAAEQQRILVTRNSRDFVRYYESGPRAIGITTAASSSGPWRTTSSARSSATLLACSTSGRTPRRGMTSAWRCSRATSVSGSDHIDATMVHEPELDSG